MSLEKRCTCYSSTSVNHTWLDFKEYARSPYIDYEKFGHQLQSGTLFNLNKAEIIGEVGLNKRTSGKDDETLPYMKKTLSL